MTARSRFLAATPTLLCVVVAIAWYAWPDASALELSRDPDSVYQLLRVQRCVEDYPAVTALDTFAHAGSTFFLHWPFGWTLVLATIETLARGLGARGGLDEMLLRLGWIPPLLGGLAVLVASRLGRRVVPAEWAAPAALVGILAGESLVAFRQGGLDHHAITALAVGMGLLAIVRERLLEWMLALALLHACSPMALPWTLILLFALAVGMGRGASRSAGTPGRRWTWLLAPAALSAAMLGLGALLEPNAVAMFVLTFWRPSLAQPLALLAAGLATALMLDALSRASASPAPGDTRARRHRIAPILGVVGVVVVVALLVILPRGMTDLGSLLAWPFTQSRAIAIAESASPVMEALAGHDWRGLALVVLAFVLSCRAARPRESTGAQAALVTACAECAWMGCWEYRHLRDLCIPIGVGGVMAASWLLRAPWTPAGLRRFLAVGTALVLVAPFPARSIRQRWELRQPDPFLDVEIRDVIRWLRTNAPDPGERTSRPAYAVLAPWSVGHHLNALGGQPVLLDPFSHADVIDTARELLLCDSVPELARRLAARHVRYIVLVAPDEQVMELGGTGEGGEGAARRELAASSALVRLYYAPESAGGDPFVLRSTGRGWRVRPAGLGFETRQDSVPLVQIYEIMPGGRDASFGGPSVGAPSRDARANSVVRQEANRSE